MMKSTADSVFDGTVGVGDVHVADAVVAVDERGDGQHFEVVGGAGVRQALVDLDFRVAEQVGDGERVAYALFHEHVAVGAGDADEFDFRAAQRVGDGERVVDAWYRDSRMSFFMIAPSSLIGCDWPFAVRAAAAFVVFFFVRCFMRLLCGVEYGLCIASQHYDKTFYQNFQIILSTCVSRRKTAPFSDTRPTLHA